MGGSVGQGRQSHQLKVSLFFCFVLYLYLVLASILQFLGELKQDLTDGGPRHVGDVRDGGPLGEDAEAAPQGGDQGLP